MKRFTAILLTGMMIFTLASCGKKAQDTPTEPATETQAAEKVEMPTETEAVTEVVTEAVKDTQQRAGLEPNGVVDRPTWAALRAQSHTACDNCTEEG